MVVGQSQTELLEIVLAGRATSRLACLLNGRTEQRDENRDDRDHDEQLNERETFFLACHELPPMTRKNTSRNPAVEIWVHYLHERWTIANQNNGFSAR